MNMSIRCEMTECKYNCVNEKYCTLNQVDIIRNEEVTTETKAKTDCGCFEPR